jgi:hypothetical protein
MTLDALDAEKACVNAVPAPSLTEEIVLLLLEHATATTNLLPVVGVLVRVTVSVLADVEVPDFD